MRNINEINELKEILVMEEYKDRFDRYMIYTDIISVARSGMSRQIKFYMKNKETGEIANITEAVAKLLEYKLTNKGAVRIGGCGMDMAYHTVSIILLRAGIITHETFYSVKWDYLDFRYI